MTIAEFDNLRNKHIWVIRTGIDNNLVKIKLSNHLCTSTAKIDRIKYGFINDRFILLDGDLTPGGFRFPKDKSDLDRVDNGLYLTHLIDGKVKILNDLEYLELLMLYLDMET